MNRMGKYGSKLAVAALAVAVWAGGGPGPGVSAESGPAGPQAPEEVERFVDAFFNQPDIQKQMAGAAVAVVKDDRVLLNKGYGYADVEQKLPVDPDRTIFRVASVSKVITATGVMQLAEQGKLDLNADVSKYLGEVRIGNRTDVPLTMRHLLMNATGFEYGDLSDSTTTDLSKEVSLKQYILDNSPTIIRQPGQFYRYDNLGFTIQGYVIEQVTGRPFGDYVQKHIFQPLGMTNSDFRLTSENLKRLAVPYNQLGDIFPTFATVPTEFPGGGMLSTSSDMARFMMAHLNGGKIGSTAILSEATTRDMLKPQLAIHPKLPNMAYGFEYSNRQDANGQYVIEKSGDVQGYHTGMWLIPDQKVGVFITVNKDFELRQPFFRAFMNHFYPAAGKQADAHEPLSTSLAEFEGTYSDLRNRMWTSRIRAEDGKLIVQDPLGEHVLHEIEPLLFQDDQGVKAAFKRNEKGEVQAFYYDLKLDSWSEKLPRPRPYDDVGPQHPYAAYIGHLRQLDVIGEESGDNLFRPEQPITREQFIGWIIRWSGLAPSKQKPVFADVADSPYAQHIQAAQELGLIQGSGGDRFFPQQPLTRQEAATIVWRMAFNHLHATPKEAKIASNTDSWAVEGVRFAVAKVLYGPEVIADQNGVIDYRPTQPMLRQEAAVLLSRFADHLF